MKNFELGITLSYDNYMKVEAIAVNEQRSKSWVINQAVSGLVVKEKQWVLPYDDELSVIPIERRVKILAFVSNPVLDTALNLEQMQSLLSTVDVEDRAIATKIWEALVLRRVEKAGL